MSIVAVKAVMVMPVVREGLNVEPTVVVAVPAVTATMVMMVVVAMPVME